MDPTRSTKGPNGPNGPLCTSAPSAGCFWPFLADALPSALAASFSAAAFSAAAFSAAAFSSFHGFHTPPVRAAAVGAVDRGAQRSSSAGRSVIHPACPSKSTVTLPALTSLTVPIISLCTKPHPVVSGSSHASWTFTVSPGRSPPRQSASNS